MAWGSKMHIKTQWTVSAQAHELELAAQAFGWVEDSSYLAERYERALRAMQETIETALKELESNNAS